jgi:hypothetical protein
MHKVCFSLPSASSVQFSTRHLLGDTGQADFPPQSTGTAIVCAAVGMVGVRHMRRRCPETVKSARTV